MGTSAARKPYRVTRDVAQLIALVGPVLGCPQGQGSSADSATEITTASASASASSSTTEGATGTTSSTTSPTENSSSTGESSGTTSVQEVCGDGVVQAGEECDDGEANADDAACTSACATNMCGDALLHVGVEECDDGEANADNAPCTASCTTNVCGDSLVLEGEEECDDGEANADSAACTAACTINVCGDGLVLEGVEECDDIDSQFSGGGDGCSATCTREVVLFVSLKRFTGDLGGPAGADAICAHAGDQSIKLPWAEQNNTIFRAWIANPDCPLDRRFPHVDRPYVRLDGEVIADNWDDFIGGLEPGSAAMNEYGLWLEEAYNLRVWTAVDGDGTIVEQASARSCNFWTLSGDSFFGAVGKADLGGVAWSQWLVEGESVVQGCHQEAHLYCLQIACDEHPEYCDPGYCAP